MIFYKGERTVLPEKPEDIHIVIDRGILEIHMNRGTGNVYYETDLDELQGKIKIEGGQGTGKVFVWRP